MVILGKCSSALPQLDRGRQKDTTRSHTGHETRAFDPGWVEPSLISPREAVPVFASSEQCAQCNAGSYERRQAVLHTVCWWSHTCRDARRPSLVGCWRSGITRYPTRTNPHSAKKDGPRRSTPNPLVQTPRGRSGRAGTGVRSPPSGTSAATILLSEA
jgi:hypothetical protein